MRPALRGNDIVDKGIGGLVISVIVLQSNLYQNSILLSLAVDDTVIQGSLSLIQILDKLPDPALIVKGTLLPGIFPFIGERDSESFC